MNPSADPFTPGAAVQYQDGRGCWHDGLVEKTEGSGRDDYVLVARSEAKHGSPTVWCPKSMLRPVPLPLSSTPAQLAAIADIVQRWRAGGFHSNAAMLQVAKIMGGRP